MHNKITIHGYLGKDPELSYQNGQNGQYAKVTFSVGVGRSYGDETDWFYCVMYGKRAETIDKFFSKGSQIIVSGRMESYKPKNDPNRTAWLLKAEDFDFCDKKDSPRGSANRAAQGEPEPTAAETTSQMGFNDLPDTFEAAEDDIPF